MHKWDIIVNGIKHEIIFDRCRISGKADLRIDGNPGTYSPVIIKRVGMFYLLEVENSEVIVKLDLQNKPVGLAQGGVYLETGLPIEEAAVLALRSSAQADDPLAQKEKVGMGSFLTVVVLTYVNLVLTLMNASISFPFSAMVPPIISSVALNGYQGTASMPVLVIGIAIAIIFASAYLVLYLLARKSTWPIIVALIFMAIDTLVVLFLALDDFTSYIIDIAFHAWVIWSIVKLIGIRRKRAKENDTLSA